MKINIHAGHNPDGKVACGAVGLIKESTEARILKDKVINLLESEGHTVYDCTINDGTNSSDVLKKIVKKCNSHDVDLDVSIHFNAGANDKQGNNKTTGVEVLIYSTESKSYDAATRICSNISKVGLKNRGVKINNSLYVLKHTNAPALLIETCFVDDKDDIELYKENINNVAKAIVKGILNEKYTKTEETTESYKVKIMTETLNVRAGAGTNYKVTTTVKKDEVYTIVDEKKNGSTIWLKLKSGAGWISQQYTKKLGE